MTHKSKTRLVISILLGSVLLSAPGCFFGLPAQIAWVVGGHKEKAEFDGLKHKRVAIVVVSDAPIYGLDRASELMARRLSRKLDLEVKGIEMIPYDDVLDWMDNNDWDKIDFPEVGRGVDAEMLVAVELSSYRLNNGKTLHQGHAHIDVAVYDMTREGGKNVWRDEVPSFQFPQNGGRPITDMTRASFEQQFIQRLSEKVANYFYDYDVVNTIATDAEGQRWH